MERDNAGNAGIRWYIQKILAFLIVCAVFAGFFVADVLLNDDYFFRPQKQQYELPEKTVSMRFIDLSSWNTVNDWSAVKASGVDGVILRIARYNLGKDERFDEYYKAAKEQGLYVGCYYFMNAETTEEAVADAQYVTGLIREGGYEFDLPVFYDVEDDATTGNTVSHLSRQELTDIIIAFCEEMLSENFYSGYYSNLNFAASYYYPKKLEKYPFWIASYSRGFKGNEYPNLTLWQSTDTGTVPGIEGDCDVNCCFVDFEAFIKEKGYNK